MLTHLLRIMCISAFCVLISFVQGYGQENTKGDKSGIGTSRTKKTSSKGSKKVRRSGSRAFKSSKGGRSLGGPLRTPSEGRTNVYPKSRLYVNNQSQTRKSAESKRGARTIKRVTPRSASSSTRNVFPQSGNFVNHSSSPQAPPRTRRVKPRTASTSFIARKSTRSWTHMPRPRPHKERAYTKDIAGKKIRTKNYQSKRPGIITQPSSQFLRTATPRNKNVYSQGNHVVRNPQKAGRRSKLIGGQSNDYVSNPASQPRNVNKPVSNSAQLSRLKRLQSTPGSRPRRGSSAASSSSRPFISGSGGRAWTHFPRPKRRREKAVTTDLAGKPLRTKNYHTQKPTLINPTAQYRPAAKRTGEKPYKGPAGGGYISRSQSGKAWNGDITNRRIRRNFTSKKGTEGRPIVTPEKRRVGMRDQGEGFTGTVKTRRPLKGGGSLSGKLWNNNRRAVAGRSPGIGARGVDKYQGNIRFGGRAFRSQGETFTGSIKARRPAKGGGTVSGKLWNNNQRSVVGRSPGIGARGVDKYQGNIRFGGKAFQNQGETFTGSIKARRPPKGGGSVSGKLWNNNQRSVVGRSPGIGARGVDKYQGNIRFGGRTFRNQGEEYTGNIKGSKPVKGGGSISRKGWNNGQQPIQRRFPSLAAIAQSRYRGDLKSSGRAFTDQGEEYTGNLKARKPLKGGGSISGKLWNNNQRAVAGRSPGIGARGIDKYQGNLRVGKIFRDQGEEYTGNIKAHKPLKGGGSVSGKLWNNSERPIAVRTPSPGAAKAGSYSGNIKAGQKVFNDQGEEFTGMMKQKKYIKNPNSNEASIKVRKAKTADETDGLQIKVRQRDYARRKNAPEGSLPGLVATKTSMKASVATRGARQYHYVKNKSSSVESLKVREAGKAFARASDFQGNIKMKKFDLFGKRGLHPDAQFVKTNKNNVADEKDMLTNFKLWWARLFKKNDTQPAHLKAKQRKPRYDGGEAGLWYD